MTVRSVHNCRQEALDVSWARDAFGFEAQTEFLSGLERTCKWWTQTITHQLEQEAALVPAFAR